MNERNPGPYLPAKKVCERYDISDRTLDRWLGSGSMDMPQPMIINRRRYFSEPNLVAWERQRTSKAAVTGDASPREGIK